MSEDVSKLIERLEEADNQLAADGYKEWCNVRIAISEALKCLQLVWDYRNSGESQSLTQ